MVSSSQKALKSGTVLGAYLEISKYGARTLMSFVLRDGLKARLRGFVIWKPLWSLFSGMAVGNVWEGMWL
jgi:hypothetical protein